MCVVQELAAVTARKSLGDAVPVECLWVWGWAGGVGRLAFCDSLRVSVGYEVHVSRCCRQLVGLWDVAWACRVPQ